MINRILLHNTVH